MIGGVSMLVPLGLSHALGDGAEPAFDRSALLTFAAGALTWLGTRRFKTELQVRDGFLLVALAWTLMPAFATAPLLLQLPGLSFTRAYFEAASALTATGSTVLSGLDELPASINFWRCQLQWMGGMGVIVLAVAILPLLGVGGAQLFKAETAGPMKDTKLTPRITQTAKGLWLIYALLTLACVVAYHLAGMDWLEAVMHGFTTLSLGGFSNHDASFAHFNAPAIEAVAIVFMMLGGINFAIHFRAVLRRRFVPYLRDPETKAFLALMVGSSLVVAGYLRLAGVYPDAWSAFRYAAFNVISVATTTGYASTDFAKWPIFAPMVMMLLCTFATCAGSTGGGIKMVRALIMLKQAVREFARIVHPHAVLRLKYGGEPVENQVIFAVLAFMLVYGCVMIIATLALLATGLDLTSAYTAVIASLSNTGSGLGEVGPTRNFAGLSPFQLWVCVASMLLGRLELFSLLVVFTPGFWRR
ncbi:MAG: TrkH family potassium uptake protein [Burkholderiales bacterium]|nr:TrkH family potassium uptake protein [Burkholderiales bacterium]